MKTGLYVHIPFCPAKCFYCSFAVCVGQEAKADAYLDDLVVEGQSYAGARIGTVYVGGGSPSQLTDAQISALFAGLRSIFSFDKNAEISFEINPEHFSRVTAEVLSRCGVNRLSIGAQTWDDRRLRNLGRRHSADITLRAFAAARNAGFKNISLDLLFGFSGQTRRALIDDLKKTLVLSPEHVSLYALTVEPGSRFFRDKVSAASPEKQTLFFGEIIDELTAAGYAHYEVSNFAKPGFAARHNLNYWEGGNYIGLGASAHSHLDGHRFWNEPVFLKYFKRMRAENSALAGEEYLTPEQRLKESLVFGLRKMAGIDMEAVEKSIGCVWDPATRERIEAFSVAGLLSRSGKMLRVTRRGLFLLDEISRRLL
ncbi:MAG: radical SAM family heme chaperone HemW [Candidatus Omnitrophica bacterium]|nr:radical SAM family heme chaperone HemW [Candidatus Omnitrophota bacterium]